MLVGGLLQGDIIWKLHLEALPIRIQSEAQPGSGSTPAGTEKLATCTVENDQSIVIPLS